MTRYGKSYFAGRIMEELLKRRATILTIDAHGDYANIAIDPEGHLHKFFHDKLYLNLKPLRGLKPLIQSL